MRIARSILALLALAFIATGAFALNVVWDDRTPEDSRKWADKHYIREQMEVVGKKICTALYGNNGRANLHENFTIILYLAPVKGGNPAFAAGRRITWKVGPNPSGNPGLGLLCHEMTHVLDMGSDSVFTEAMADWTRNYKVNFRGCSNPPYVLGLRYKALRGGRHYGKYVAGAHFIDFMTQSYGEGTIYRILQGYKQHGKGHWEKTFGKNFDGLVSEWRNMQTIYDPVYQWTYNGTSSGVVRHDGKFCSPGSVRCEDTPNGIGAWLTGVTATKVNKCGGDMTIALHGRLPRKGKVAIASLGSAREGNGKALLLATTSARDSLAAHVVASVPGKGCAIVSTTAVPVPNLAAGPHSIILTTRGGDMAAVIVDGKPAAKVDMKAKCDGCTFTPAFAVGGMAGGTGVHEISEPNGEGGVCLNDVRVFTRTFRERETKQYATTFGPDYRGAVAVAASWCGGQGDSDVGNPNGWFCVNSLGERVHVLPTKDTAVTVSGTALPSIPPGTKFACKSFTIDGWAVADSANVDLRGVRIVDVDDNARIITRNGHGIAVNAIRANRIRLDGNLAVVGGIKATGNLEMREGSSLRFPANPDMTLVKSISVRGKGPVVLKPGVPAKRGSFQKILRIEEMPADLTRFRLNAGSDEKAATFSAAPGGKYLGVTPYR